MSDAQRSFNIVCCGTMRMSPAPSGREVDNVPSSRDTALVVNAVRTPYHAGGRVHYARIMRARCVIMCDKYAAASTLMRLTYL